MPADDDIIQRIDSLKKIQVHDEAAAQAVDLARQRILHGTSRQAVARAGLRGSWTDFAFRPWFVRLATPLTVILVFLAALLLTPGNKDAPRIFASVLEAVAQTEAAFCQLTNYDELGKPLERQSLYLSANGNCRIVGEDGRYTVHDFRQSKSLIVDPDKKQGWLLHGRPKTPNINLYEYLRDLHRTNPAIELGTDHVDGKEVLKFQATIVQEGISPTRAIIWADARSKLPVQIELATLHNDVSMTYAMIRHIRFYAEPDPTLFSTELPSGYALVNPVREAAERLLYESD